MSTLDIVFAAGVVLGLLGWGCALLRDSIRLSWLVKLLTEGDREAAREFVAERPGFARLLASRDIWL